MKSGLIISLKATQLLLFFQIVNGVPGQSPVTDRLQELLNEPVDLYARVRILDEIAECQSDSSLDEFFLNVRAQLRKAQEEQSPEGLAAANLELGLIYFCEGKYTEAVKHLEYSLEHHRESGNQQQAVRLVSYLGSLQYLVGRYESAIDYYLSALKMEEEVGNSLRTAILYLNIGSVYMEQSTFHDLARVYYLRSIRICESLGYLEVMGIGTMDLGQLYYYQKAYDSSLFYLEKSLLITSDRIHNANALNDMGRIYAVQGEFDRALGLQLDALRILADLDADTEKTRVLQGLAETHSSQNQNREAISYLLKAKDLAEKNTLNSQLPFIYKSLSDNYLNTNDFRSAYLFLTLYNESDHFSSQSDSRSLRNTIWYNYQLEKKQDEIEILEQQSVIEKLKNRRQRAMTLAFGLFGLIVLLVSAGFYNRFQYIRRTNRKMEMQSKEIKKKNRLITDSINYAQRIQSALLPSSETLSRVMPSHFILLKPKDIVSGDFYWIKQIEDHLVIFDADCTGHGVPGAFMSILGITLLTDLVSVKCFEDPGAILEQLRRKIKLLLAQENGYPGEQKDGMDAALVILNKKTREIRFAGANNPLYIIRKRSGKTCEALEPFISSENGNYRLFEIKPDKQPIGTYWQENPFTTFSVCLQEQDSFYLFSDGFMDQYGGTKRRKFMATNFKSLLLSIQEYPMPVQKTHLEQSFDNWRGQHEQLDDVSVIGVRV